MKFVNPFPVLVNDVQMTNLARRVALDLVGEDELIPDLARMTGSEDFAYFLEKYPGSYLIIGNGNGEGNCMFHNPGYDFNNACLMTGAAYWVKLAETFLIPRPGKGSHENIILVSHGIVHSYY